MSGAGGMAEAEIIPLAEAVQDSGAPFRMRDKFFVHCEIARCP
jgi:hypothetical protein